DSAVRGHPAAVLHTPRRALRRRPGRGQLHPGPAQPVQRRGGVPGGLRRRHAVPGGGRDRGAGLWRVRLGQLSHHGSVVGACPARAGARAGPERRLGCADQALALITADLINARLIDVSLIATQAERYVQCASSQLAPTPASTISGTRSFAAPCIACFTAASISSTNAASTSNTSSSCTCMIISARSACGASQSCTLRIARLMM